MREASSKQAWEDDYEMEAEYDFSDGIPNPFAEMALSTRVVTLDEDVHVAFPDSQSVNEALRVFMKTLKNMKDLPKAS
jgi:hypothetical protein